MAIAPLSVPPGIRRGGRRILFADVSTEDAEVRPLDGALVTPA